VSRPLVTVVTPSYNQGEYLRETLESVLAQEYPNLEYIVVDDGSTDGSVEIVREYADRLAWWTQQPNAGQVVALKNGFAHSHGELLGWLNSDDTYLRGAIEAVVAEFERDPELLLVYGDNVLIDPESREIAPLKAREFDVAEMLRTAQNHVPQPGAFFRREALELAPLNEAGYYYFDFEFHVALGAHGRTKRIDRVLGGYRIHPVAKSVSAPRRKAHDQLRMVDAVFALRELPPDARAVEPEARSKAEVVAAEYFYAAGDHRQALCCLVRSLARRPRVGGRFAAGLLLKTLLPPRLAGFLRARRMRQGSPAPSAPS
jgi:glycosyltransferase involved in cell wall biosynthesis